MAGIPNHAYFWVESFNPPSQRIFSNEPKKREYMLSELRRTCGDTDNDGSKKESWDEELAEWLNEPNDVRIGFGNLFYITLEKEPNEQVVKTINSPAPASLWTYRSLYLPEEDEIRDPSEMVLLKDFEPGNWVNGIRSIIEEGHASLYNKQDPSSFLTREKAVDSVPYDDEKNPDKWYMREYDLDPKVWVGLDFVKLDSPHTSPDPIYALARFFVVTQWDINPEHGPYADEIPMDDSVKEGIRHRFRKNRMRL